MASSRYGFGSLLFVACWTTAPPPTVVAPVSKPLAPVERDLSGKYWCWIDEYPRYPCAIKKVDGRMVLAKLAGSQRIRGAITLNDQGGFSFAGELYCPWGDCQQELNGTFTPAGRDGFKGEEAMMIGRGAFKGSFQEDTMIVMLQPASRDDAWGGDQYGGSEYGGDPFDVGGAQYGGLKYRIDIRGRRRP